MSLTWDDVISAGDYFVERGNVSSGRFTQITIRSENQPNYIRNGSHLLPTTTYHYRVQAKTSRHLL